MYINLQSLYVLYINLESVCGLYVLYINLESVCGLYVRYIKGVIFL